MSVSKHLSQKKRFGGLFALSRDYLLIFAIGYTSIVVDNPIFYLVSVWLIGFVQFAIGESLLHEAAHGHLSTSRQLNSFFGLFCTYPFFNVMDSYKKSHFNHHKYLGDPKYDESAEIYHTYGLYKPKPNLLWLWFFKPVLGGSIYFFITETIWVKLKRHPIALPIFWLSLTIVVSYLGLLNVFLLYWIVPLMWCFPCYLYWAEITDHYRAKSGTRSNVNPIYNLLTHNGGYHSVHHKYPTIPWFNLQEAHKVLCQQDTSLNEDLTMGIFDTYRQIKKNDDKNAH